VIAALKPQALMLVGRGAAAGALLLDGDRYSNNPDVHRINLKLVKACDCGIGNLTLVNDSVLLLAFCCYRRFWAV
jgi:hypothetical protein